MHAVYDVQTVCIKIFLFSPTTQNLIILSKLSKLPDRFPLWMAACQNFSLVFLWGYFFRGKAFWWYWAIILCVQGTLIHKITYQKKKNPQKTLFSWAIVKHGTVEFFQFINDSNYETRYKGACRSQGRLSS